MVDYKFPIFFRNPAVVSPEPISSFLHIFSKSIENMVASRSANILRSVCPAVISSRAYATAAPAFGKTVNGFVGAIGNTPLVCRLCSRLTQLTYTRRSDSTICLRKPAVISSPKPSSCPLVALSKTELPFTLSKTPRRKVSSDLVALLSRVPLVTLG